MELLLKNREYTEGAMNASFVILPLTILASWLSNKRAAKAMELNEHGIERGSTEILDKALRVLLEKIQKEDIKMGITD